MRRRLHKLRPLGGLTCESYAVADAKKFSVAVRSSQHRATVQLKIGNFVLFLAPVLVYYEELYYSTPKDIGYV